MEQNKRNETTALERNTLERDTVDEYKRNRTEIVSLALLGANPDRLAYLRRRQAELFLTRAVQTALLRGE